ncbi:MAG: transposase [Gammaproteobacteria bacterium]|nr:transposase [Ideonella sp.]MCC6715356.1 transposase [Gammaproteobacteria bacterium]
MDTKTTDKVVRRRQYSAAFKAQVVAECEAPGASVAKVALAHGINSNIVHGWRKLARGPAASASEPVQFVPVTIGPAPGGASCRQDIEVELRRGAVTMKIIWPAAGAADFAAFTRELLR